MQLLQLSSVSIHEAHGLLQGWQALSLMKNPLRQVKQILLPLFTPHDVQLGGQTVAAS
jgi:hypothetical protein